MDGELKTMLIIGSLLVAAVALVQIFVPGGMVGLAGVLGGK